MSTFNLHWLAQCLGSQPTVSLHLGCADITNFSFRLQTSCPGTTLWSFECAEIWKESNTAKSKLFNLNYVHKAVSDQDGQAVFYEGAKTDSQTQDHWQYRGRMDNPFNPDHDLNYGEESLQSRNWIKNTVETVSLNTFFADQQIVPDFIYSETTGEEFNIFKTLRPEYWPTIAWINRLNRYHAGNNTFVDLDCLENLFYSRGCVIVHREERGILFVKQGIETPVYTAFDMTTESCRQHEKIIQQKIWLQRYHVIKDSAWPDLDTVADFYKLPWRVIDECRKTYSLEPHASIL